MAQYKPPVLAEADIDNGFPFAVHLGHHQAQYYNTTECSVVLIFIQELDIALPNESNVTLNLSFS